MRRCCWVEMEVKRICCWTLTILLGQLTSFISYITRHLFPYYAVSLLYSIIVLFEAFREIFYPECTNNAKKRGESCWFTASSIWVSRPETSIA